MLTFALGWLVILAIVRLAAIMKTVLAGEWAHYTER